MMFYLQMLGLNKYMTILYTSTNFSFFPFLALPHPLPPYARLQFPQHSGVRGLCAFLCGDGRSLFPLHGRS